MTISPSPLHSFKRHAVLRRVELRNAFLWMLQCVAGAFSTPLAPAALVGAILVRLGGSDLTIGLVTTVASAVAIPGMLLGAHLGGLTRRKGLAALIWQFLSVWAYLPPVLVLLLGGTKTGLAAFTAAFMAATVLGTLTASVAGVLQVDLLSRITVPERRGRVTGIAGSISGIAGLAGGGLLTLLLRRQAFPAGYLTACWCGLAAGTVGLFAYLLYRELPALKTASGVRLPGILQSLREIAGDRRFLLVLAAAMLKFIFNGVTIFLIPTALRRYGLSDAFVGHMAILAAVITISVSPLQGWSADRWGISRTALLGAVLGAAGLAVFPHVSRYLFVLGAAAAVTAGAMTLNGMVFLVPMQISPPEHRAAYIAMRYVAESVAGVICLPAIGYALTAWQPAYTFYTGSIAAVASGLLLVYATDHYRHAEKRLHG